MMNITINRIFYIKRFVIVCCLIFVQFVKFANIEEDTPSYHRRYDFFVSKFSSMCHNSDRSTATRSRYETAHYCYNGTSEPVAYRLVFYVVIFRFTLLIKLV